MRRSVIRESGDNFLGSPSKRKSSDDLEKAIYLKKHVKDAKDVRQMKSVWSYVKEFTQNTSLHGLKYIGEARRPIVEKLWWCTMFILSAAVCGQFIFKVWTKWQQSPVIVTLAEKSTPVWQVPFPAITVCSENRCQRNVYNFSQMYLKHDNLTEEERKDFETISVLCESPLMAFGQNVTDKINMDLLIAVAPSAEEMFMYCRWKTFYRDCGTIFSPILTDNGVCQTFNILSAEELFRTEELHTDYSYLNNTKESEGWTLENGYPKELPLETYPRRGTKSGTSVGLTMYLKANNTDLDYLCSGPVQGFKVLLHTPTEVPSVTQQYFRVPLGQEVIAAIKPNMMTTSEGLRSYDAKRRQCYFPSERRLRYYKIYTQQNCETECLTNYTIEACGCVSMAMPRDSTMPICMSHIECIMFAQEDLLMWEIKKGIEESRAGGGKRKVHAELQQIAENCDCLPACTAITYDAETSQASYDLEKVVEAVGRNLSFMENYSMAKVVIFFKESNFITQRRSELYGQTDFLANCGGLLGLFLGFSFLSFIEIVYFFTLRYKQSGESLKNMMENDHAVSHRFISGCKPFASIFLRLTFRPDTRILFRVNDLQPEINLQELNNRRERTFNQDAKREEFWQYLEKSKIFNVISRGLVRLYDEKEWPGPDTCIERIMRHLGGVTTEEFEETQVKIIELEKELAELQPPEEEGDEEQ